MGAAPRPQPGLHLPASGRGAAASWLARIAALAVDWFASTLVALGLFGGGVLTAHDWRAWATLAVFFVESTVLTVVLGGTFGHRLVGVGVASTDGRGVSPARAALRAMLICLVIPALVVGPDRRSLADTVAGTVIVNTRR